MSGTDYRQQRHIEALIARYTNDKTSKQLAQHRPVLADIRASTNFSFLCQRNALSHCWQTLFGSPGYGMATNI